MNNKDYLSKSQISTFFLRMYGCKISKKKFFDIHLPRIESHIDIRGNSFNLKQQKHVEVWSKNEIIAYIIEHRKELQ